jgi:hypothetical protein
MALKAVLTKPEFEALADVLREHYAAAGDNYVLDADIDTHPAVGGLKSALDKERKAKAAADKEYKAFKDQIGDLDPEAARAAIARIQELSDKKLIDEGKADEMWKARADAMNKNHQAEIQARDKRSAELEASLKLRDNELVSIKLDTSIVNEMIKAGVRKEHLQDVLYRVKESGIDNIRWTLGEDGKVVAKVGDEIKYGKDGIQPMPVLEGLEALRKNVATFFEPSGGGGAHNSTARADGNRFVISEGDAKDHGKWKEAKAVADKAGQPLVIVSAA